MQAGLVLKCAHVYVYVKQATLKVEFEVIQTCYVPSELKKSVVVAKCVDKKKSNFIFHSSGVKRENIIKWQQKTRPVIHPLPLALLSTNFL